MLIKDCFFLGVITKKYSFRGEIIIKFEGDKSKMYTKLDSVYIESNGTLVSHKINKIQKHKSDFLRLSLKGIDNENDAERLLKKNVYLPLSMLPPLSGKNFYYHEIYGFLAIDNEGDKIGEIKSVRDLKKQSLFVIDHKGIEILVPVHNDLIENIDRERKEIKINIPEGLIDIFKK
ncbi:MAG: ribosome maturation factor RimM [Bacteroidota bacterium]|nr:ribosome maturation factor RimM [Bacteroidota bacterium]